MNVKRRFWIGLMAMALLSPLGIFLPDAFKSKEAWGEWAPETLQRLLGYVPEGLRRGADIWKAPIPDYSFFGDGADLALRAAAYILSAILGMLIAGGMMFFISRILRKNE